MWGGRELITPPYPIIIEFVEIIRFVSPIPSRQGWPSLSQPSFLCLHIYESKDTNGNSDPQNVAPSTIGENLKCDYRENHDEPQNTDNLLSAVAFQPGNKNLLI